MSRYFSSREDSVADGNFTRGTAASGRPRRAGRARWSLWRAGSSS